MRQSHAEGLSTVPPIEQNEALANYAKRVATLNGL